MPKHFNSYGSEPFGMGEGDTVSTSKENLIFIVLEFELKAVILIHVVIYLDKTKNSISSFAVEEAWEQYTILVAQRIIYKFL